MKNIIVLAMALTLTFGAHADISKKANGLAVLISSGVILTPDVSAACIKEANPADCLYRFSYSWGALSSSTTLNKEEVQNVEVDAYDFLAGNPKSLALDEVITRARQDLPESVSLSDEQITVLLMSILL